MGSTDNGYSAPPVEGIRQCGWDGAYAVPGVKDWDPVWKCFQYLMREFDTRVEWLRPGWCWGFAYRANANNPNALSRHSGAIAVDLNAPLHPNGVPTSQVFTSAQRATINRILDEVRCPCHGNRVFRWGGDYTGTPDAMHFEINVPPLCVTNASRNLDKEEFTMDAETKKEMRELLVDLLNPMKQASVEQTQRIMTMERQSAERDLKQARLLRAVAKSLGVENPNRQDVEKEADDLESKAKESIKRLDEMEAQPDHD